nr:hypothetical protein CFP56_37065 [Quercus suber]
MTAGFYWRGISQGGNPNDGALCLRQTEAATCVQSGSFKQRERCTTGVDRKTHEADAACSVGVDADEAR